MLLLPAALGRVAAQFLREIVLVARPISRAILRSPLSLARRIVISSRSEEEGSGRWASASWLGGMSPAWRNDPVLSETASPTVSAASAEVTRIAIRRENAGCTSRDGSGLPGDRIGRLSA